MQIIFNQTSPTFKSDCKHSTCWCDVWWYFDIARLSDHYIWFLCILQDWQVNCYQHQCIWLVLHYMSYQISISTCPSHCWEKPYLLCYWGHFHFRKNYFKMDYLPHIDGLVKERHNCSVSAMEWSYIFLVLAHRYIYKKIYYSCPTVFMFLLT